MKVVYLTDGLSRTIQIGNRQIILKRTTPRNMATAGKTSGLLIQALRHLGQRHVDDQIIAQLDRDLDANTKIQLMKDIRYAPPGLRTSFANWQAGRLMHEGIFGNGGKNAPPHMQPDERTIKHGGSGRGKGFLGLLDTR